MTTQKTRWRKTRSSANKKRDRVGKPKRIKGKNEKQFATPLKIRGEGILDQTTPSATARTKRPKQHLNPICTSAQSRENTKTTKKKFMADHAKNWKLNVPLCSTHQKSERTKIKAQLTKKERQKRITNRHTAKSRMRREIGSNDPRRDSEARAAKATPKSYLYIGTKPGKQKTTAKNYGRPRESWTLIVPLQHATKNANGQKNEAQPTEEKQKREKRVATSLNPGGE